MTPKLKAKMEALAQFSEQCLDEKQREIFGMFTFALALLKEEVAYTEVVSALAEVARKCYDKEFVIGGNYV